MNWVRVYAIAVCLVIGQGVPMATVSAQSFAERVASDEAAYTANKLKITGRVIDESGRPVKNALVRLYAWGDNSANNGRKAISNNNGRFAFSGLSRRNALLKVSRAGYYNEILPLDLQQPATANRYYAGTLKLYRKRSGRVRMIFGGDTMMGRRFFDRDNDGEWGEDDDVLRQATISSNSKALFKFVRQALTGDDQTVINLETPVTDNPLTPHPTKLFSFYTRPESSSGLRTVGIDAVSLGNNHVYDYLEQGMVDTIDALNQSGSRWFGAGMSESDAKASRMRIRLNDIKFSLQGFSELTEDASGSVALQIVAHDAPDEKGGALALNNSTLQEFVDSESPNRFTVPVMHGGREYQNTQPKFMRDYFKLAIERGADMVVAHHPHVPHGVSFYNAGKGPRWIFGSLGNFVFDQQVYESFQSYLAMVDIQRTAAGPRVKRVQLLPYRIDNYSPRFLTGDGLTRMARALGHLSTHESEQGDGIAGATVFEQKGRIYANVSPYYFNVVSTFATEEVAVSSGTAPIVEFVPVKPSDSLSGLKASRDATCRLGRDLGVLGSFEEQDVDDQYQEGDIWQQTGSRFVQSSESHTGRSAMAIIRNATDSARASTWLGNKMRMTQGDVLTLTGFAKTANAGRFVISVRWMTDSDTLSQEDEYEEIAGSHDWQRFSVDLTVPLNANGVKIYYRQYPPESGEGLVFLDDLALVTWNEEQSFTDTEKRLAGPNDWRFLRCSAIDDGELSLTLRRDTYSVRK